MNMGVSDEVLLMDALCMGETEFSYSGVPQGSILGPTIADWFRSRQGCWGILYEDRCVWLRCFDGCSIIYKQN